jgi:hypothetical protein
MRVTTETLVVLASLQCLSAYTIHHSKVSNTMIKGIHQSRGVSKLYSSSSPATDVKSQKLLRLNAMAAKLRAEASQLEVIYRYTYIYIYVYICMYVYIYTYLQTIFVTFDV